MAYENMTYEVILQRMIKRITDNYPNLDTREGSIIFNALAPAAVELAIMYTELDNVLNESFVATASREYLLLACQQMGIDTDMFEASAGVHYGEFDVTVPIGSRWNCELYNYKVIDYVGFVNGNYRYALQCETAGANPNGLIGSLTPISDVPNNLKVANLCGCVIEGEDETPDETIRKIYFNYINNEASDGNVAQYERWCNEYDGIGTSKIIPLWDGENTVKVLILNASNRAASKELIDEFQEYLDPNSSGLGDGVAPIGAVVTVQTVTESPIELGGKITIDSNSTLDGITKAINQSVTDYFAQIALRQDRVSYLSLAAKILNVDGVVSLEEFTLNGVASDFVLGNLSTGDIAIPVLGHTEWWSE